MPGRKPDVLGGCFGLWLVLCALLGLVMTGVLIWAVISLVNHFTA
ncbi:hypothetical protein ACFYY8_31225 [Streptosporangium sp. NPDC001559]